MKEIEKEKNELDDDDGYYNDFEPNCSDDDDDADCFCD
jgi:hypothetical protein